MIRLHSPPPNARRKGVVVVFVAVCLVVLIGVAAISVDGGNLLLEHRKARSTADASAMAAACQLYAGHPSNKGKDADGKAKSDALKVAAANGYGNDGNTTTVTVNIPPQNGPYTGKDGYVEVIVKKNVQRGFSRIFGSEPLPVQARAVARGDWTAANAGVLILDYDDSASLNAQGNGAFTETGGPVIVNSSNPNALVTTGNGIMRGQEFYITGGVKVGSNASLATFPVANQIFLGTHPTPDPLAYLPVPDVPPDGTMTVTNIGAGNKMYVLSPGRFTNLPTFNTGDVVVLKQASAGNNGIYYIDGGGFKSTGATIRMDPLTSGGVMIYNQPASTASSEKIQITGNSAGSVDLSPLTEGPYQGMMLWQDRTSPVDVLVEGNGTFSVKGTFYAAGAKLNINGNGKTETGDSSGGFVDDNGNLVTGGSQIGSQYVSKNLSLGGNGNITIHYRGPEVARTRIITLVE